MFGFFDLADGFGGVVLEECFRRVVLEEMIWERVACESGFGGFEKNVS